MRSSSERAHDELLQSFHLNAKKSPLGKRASLWVSHLTARSVQGLARVPAAAAKSTA